MGRRRSLGGVIIAGLFLGGSLAASRAIAQAPEKATNLKFFPPDTPVADLIQTMRQFSFSLGVRCQFCHAQKPGGTGE